MPFDYTTLKLVHQTAVALSIGGFAARAAGAWAGAAWVRHRVTRTLPHVVDTVLLLSAVALAWTIGLNPLVTPWLGAKIVALLVYIGLGRIALQASRPRAVRAGAGVAALLVAGYIVSVAITKQVLPGA